MVSDGIRVGVSNLQHLKAEHREIFERISSDSGMSPDTRALLVRHLLEEEDDKVRSLLEATGVEMTTESLRISDKMSPNQLDFLRAEVMREAQRTLVARRFLRVYGPLGAGIESMRVEQYGPDKDAEIDLVGNQDPDPIRSEREFFIRVPIIYKDFVMHWRDVEFSRKLGAPIDASRAIRAAHCVADSEDQLLFNGDERFGLEGLLNATGRCTVPRGDWKTYGQAYRDVVAAMEALLAHNHHRPFALAVSAQDYARLIKQREGQFAPEIDAIHRLCDDGVYMSPVIPEGQAVMLSTGDQNFDIAVAEDLTLTSLGEHNQDYPFRVYECLVLRIKRPKAICTIA